MRRRYDINSNVHCSSPTFDYRFSSIKQTINLTRFFVSFRCILQTVSETRTVNREHFPYINPLIFRHECTVLCVSARQQLLILIIIK